MSTTTTIRVSRETHSKLVELSEATGQSMGSVLEDALEALITAHFAQETVRQLDALRADPAAWAAYLADSDLPAGHDLAG